MDPEENFYFSPDSSNFPSGSFCASMEISQSSSIPIGSSSFDPPISFADPLLSPQPIGFSGSPLNFETFSPLFESNVGSSSSFGAGDDREIMDVPQPLECLQGTPIPPFLSKTYDLVEDPNLDPTISWAPRGESFVIWDPVEFARLVLPRNFKHNNFSSFVRQLNTYGFRKVDPDKWEFANEGFCRGKRQLLRNIHRRKSPHSQQFSTYGVSSAETAKFGMGSEIEKLKKEKSALVQEVVEIQQQQRGTAEFMEKVKHRLQASEQRQKQMVSFLAKMLQNPSFLDHLKQMKQQKTLSPPRAKRKFLKKKQQESGGSGLGTDMGGELVRYKPELMNLGDLASPGIAASSAPDSLLEDVVGKLSIGIESMPFQTEDVASDELVATQELLNIPQLGGPDPTSSVIGDPCLRGKQAGSRKPASAAEYFVSFPEELAKESTIPGFSSPGIENSIKQEDVWSMGLDLSAGMSTSIPGLLGHDASYHVPDIGPLGPCEFSDMMDLGSFAAGSSGVEKWPSNESVLGVPQNKAFESKDSVGSRNIG